MKTKTLTFILCCIAYINSFSQDVIIKNDGKKLEVIIKKVNKNNIKYILFNDPNKVTYTIDKVLITNVDYIVEDLSPSGKKPDRSTWSSFNTYTS
jgi:hypothetical protein